MNKTIIAISLLTLILIVGCSKNYNAEIVCRTQCDGEVIKHEILIFPYRENIVCTTGETNISLIEDSVENIRLECRG